MIATFIVQILLIICFNTKDRETCRKHEQKIIIFVFQTYIVKLYSYLQWSKFIMAPFTPAVPWFCQHQFQSLGRVPAKTDICSSPFIVMKHLYAQSINHHFCEIQEVNWIMASVPHISIFLGDICDLHPPPRPSKVATMKKKSAKLF